MANKDNQPFDIPDPEAAGWKEDPDRPGYWLWDTEQPVTEAPEDGKQYGRQDADWTEIVIPSSQWQGGSGGISTNASKAIVGQENTEGVGLYASGSIRVWETSQNNNYLWSGYGGGSVTSQIQADGDAKFAGNVDLLGVGRYGRASFGFDTNQIFPRNSSDLAASGAVDLGTSATKWRDGWFGGKVSAGDGSTIHASGQVYLTYTGANNSAEFLRGTSKDGVRTVSIEQNGSATFSGTVNATSFVGDGSQLTGIDIPDVDLTGYATETWVSSNYQPKGSYLTSADLNGYAKYSDNPANFTNDVKAARLDSSVWARTGSNIQLNLSSSMLYPTKADGSGFSNGEVSIGRSGCYFKNGLFTGNVSAGAFYGDGSNLTNLPSSGISAADVTALYEARTNIKVYTYASGGRVNGNLLATSDVYAYYSDERLKTKTGEIENALDKVDEIDCFYYTHNDIARSLGYEGDDQQVGVSAQSVKAVMPECVALAPIDDDGEGVSVSGEDYMTVKYERLVPLLLQSIKELRKEVEELKRDR